MKLKHCYLFVLAAALCAALLGCAASEPPAESTSAAPQETASIPATAPAAEPSAQAPEDGQSAVLYVGTRRAGFQEYDMDYQGELTPELLIQGIADLTGWDLTLAEPVTDGKGGMSVCLAEGSSLFQGPPDPRRTSSTCSARSSWLRPFWTASKRPSSKTSWPLRGTRISWTFTFTWRGSRLWSCRSWASPGRWTSLTSGLNESERSLRPAAGGTARAITKFYIIDRTGKR